MLYVWQGSFSTANNILERGFDRYAKVYNRRLLISNKCNHNFSHRKTIHKRKSGKLLIYHRY